MRLTGRCSCGETQYELEAEPMVVHACHCRWCQRETGSAFVLNALIERARLQVTAGHSEPVLTPSESGMGQTIHRCPQCKVALWSHYAGSGPAAAFVRVGTLDDPARCPAPHAHIFTASALPWVRFPEGAQVFAAYYEDRATVWPAQGLARFDALRPQIAAWQARRQPMTLIDP